MLYRLLMPSTRLLSGVVPLYVKTGPVFGDFDCKKNRLVKIDVVTGDFVRLTDMERQIEHVHLTVASRTLHTPTLTVIELLKSKLRAYDHRVARKDLSDIVFLVEKYRAIVVEAKKQLDQAYVRFAVERADDPREKLILAETMLL
jgi:hypothetical protein